MFDRSLTYLDIVGKARQEQNKEIYRMFVSYFDALSSFFKKSEKRIAYEQLSSMNDRELADIGISRGDIPYIVSGKVPSTSYRRI